jgi:hypothetical protein
MIATDRRQRWNPVRRDRSRDHGSTVSGTVLVTGTVDPVNGPRTQNVEFYLDDEYLLTDYRSSSNSAAVFDFELPTELWVDGADRLKMLAIRH